MSSRGTRTNQACGRAMDICSKRSGGSRRASRPIARRSTFDRPLAKHGGASQTSKPYGLTMTTSPQWNPRWSRRTYATKTASTWSLRLARQCTTPSARTRPSTIMRRAMRFGASSIRSTVGSSPEQSSAALPYSRLRCLGVAGDATRRTRFSLSACRARDRPWSSRYCRRTARSKAHPSFLTCQC